MKKYDMKPIEKTMDDAIKKLGGLFNPNPVEELNKIIEETFPDTDSEGYDLDEDGNRLSCCGDVLDPDFMICPTCKEHC